jgi:hypothetical protein
MGAVKIKPLAEGLLVGLGYIKRGVLCIPMAIARKEFRYQLVDPFPT